MKQNTVYLFADGKTTSYDAGFGYRSLNQEMRQTLKEAIQDAKATNKPVPITLLFVQDGEILGSLNSNEFLHPNS